MLDIEKRITNLMEENNFSRLEAIVMMDLGVRSEAARRVLEKRSRRKELMSFGLTFEQACLVVNQQNQ